MAKAELEKGMYWKQRLEKERFKDSMLLAIKMERGTWSEEIQMVCINWKGQEN